MLELLKLTIRCKIQLIDEIVTKMLPSFSNKHLVYLATSIGRFVVYDSRSTSSEMLLSEYLHCSGIIDFVVSEKEDFVFTSSIDRTVNMIKLDKLLLI